MISAWPDGIKLAWAMPHTMSVISTVTHYSLFGVIRPDHIDYLTAIRGGDISEKREMQTEEALKLGCTHIWFIDGDMGFPQNILIDLFRVIEQGADLAGGLCYRGYPPWEPIAWHPTEKRMLLPSIDFTFGDVINARATGLACLLVKREVFEGLKRPWFIIKRDEEDIRRVREGEDFYFTSKATEAGFKLKIHTGYDVDHMREIPINREFFLMANLAGKVLGKDKNWKRVGKLFLKLNDPDWLDRALQQS